MIGYLSQAEAIFWIVVIGGIGAMIGVTVASGNRRDPRAEEEHREDIKQQARRQAEFQAANPPPPNTLTTQELIRLENAAEADPDNFPFRAPGQHIDEFWTYWTPARLEEWRRRRGA